MMNSNVMYISIQKMHIFIYIYDAKEGSETAKLVTNFQQ